MREAFLIEEGGRGLVVLSDREKGLDAATNELLPNAAHGYCVVHIERNVLKRFKGVPKELLWKAAKAASTTAFESVMAEMKAQHRGMGEYIEKIDEKKWARSSFPVRRFGHVTSNIAESMNNWLEEARHMDPVRMFAYYVRRLNVLFEQRRLMYASLRDDALPPDVAETLDKSIKEGRKLRVIPHNATTFEVQRLNDKVFPRRVNLEAPSCTCGFFEEHGIPCRHICAAAILVRIHPKTLVVPARLLPELRAVYACAITPVDGNLLHNDGTQPPAEKKQRGRPRTKRIPSCLEKKPKRTVTCSKCGASGHIAKTCNAHSN